MATFTGSFGRLLIIGAVALSSAALVYRLIATIPGFQLPGTLDEVKEQARILRQLQHDEPGHVMTAFVAIYLFKQTFAIPGSFLLVIITTDNSCILIVFLIDISFIEYSSWCYFRQSRFLVCLSIDGCWCVILLFTIGSGWWSTLSAIHDTSA
jgi:hypothetical protein